MLAALLIVFFPFALAWLVWMVFWPTTQAKKSATRGTTGFSGLADPMTRSPTIRSATN
jgi:hypothetical protein